MQKLVPAILTNDKKDFQAKLDLARQCTDFIQIDFMDGLFVQNTSLKPKDIFHMDFGSITFEGHLMVSRPNIEYYINALKTFKQCSRIIIHREMVDRVDEMNQVINFVKNVGKEVGIALNPETDIRQLGDFFHKIDLILFMGVKPGFYGSVFNPEGVDNVIAFKERYPDFKGIIGFDGGVREDTIKPIFGAGVDYAAIGSAFYKAKDPVENFKKLEFLINV